MPDTVLSLEDTAVNGQRLVFWSLYSSGRDRQVNKWVRSTITDRRSERYKMG